MNFLSIACGTAGEESWLVNRFNKVVLVDRDKQAIEKYFNTYNIR